MQDAAVRHFEASGWASPERPVEGTCVVRSHHIDYLRPAFLGDSIEVRAWGVEFRHVRSTRQYEFVRMGDGMLLMYGETHWAFISTEAGRPIAIPDAIQQAFLAFGRQEE